MGGWISKCAEAYLVLVFEFDGYDWCLLSSFESRAAGLEASLSYAADGWCDCRALGSIIVFDRLIFKKY